MAVGLATVTSAIIGLVGRYSSEAGEVLMRAAAEADALNHDYLGAEHLLLALAESGEASIAARSLHLLGFDVGTARSDLAAIARLPPQRKPALPPEGVFYTPALHRLGGRAEGLKLAQGAAEVTPEHLLLAMIWQGHGLCLSLLHNQGVSTRDVHQRLRDLGVEVTSEEPPEYVPTKWGERIAVGLDDIRAVVRALTKALPVGTFGFNYEGDHAYVVASEGVDIQGRVDEVVTSKRSDHVDA
jgi:ATP-dependent Clp protease ATP-binding subunit ClpA